MNTAPSFDDIFAVMSAASIGDLSARVAMPDNPPLADTATRFAIALNVLLDDLALRAADGRRELAEHERLANRLQILADASIDFSAATGELSHLLDVVARRLGEVVGDLCVIRLTTEDGEWLESTGAAFHRDPRLLAATRELMLSERQRVGEGISGRAAATGQLLFTPTIRTSDFVALSEPRFRPFLERLAVTSAITLPLVYQGNVVGVANVMRSSPGDPYDVDDLRFVQSVADHAGLALGNARSRAAERAALDAAHQAAKALAEAEARFARLSESGIIGIVVSDLNGRIVEANDALLDLVGFVLDLTERKAALAAVERLNRERASDAKFRALLETAPDAMAIVGDRGTIVLVNNRVEALFGYERTELVGQPMPRRSWRAPKRLPKAQGANWKHSATPSPTTCTRHCEE